MIVFVTTGRLTANFTMISAAIVTRTDAVSGFHHRLLCSRWLFALLSVSRAAHLLEVNQQLICTEDPEPGVYYACKPEQPVPGQISPLISQLCFLYFVFFTAHLHVLSLALIDALQKSASGDHWTAASILLQKVALFFKTLFKSSQKHDRSKWLTSLNGNAIKHTGQTKRALEVCTSELRTAIRKRNLNYAMAKYNTEARHSPEDQFHSLED